MPKRSPRTVAVACRLEEELVQRMDRVIALLASPWSQWTRSDVLRACVIEGLPFVEKYAREHTPNIPIGDPDKPVTPYAPMPPLGGAPRKGKGKPGK